MELSAAPSSNQTQTPNIQNVLKKYLNTEEMETISSAGFSLDTGLRFSLEELETKRIEFQENKLQKIDLHQASTYADAITFIKTNKNDVEFLRPMLTPLPPNKTVHISLTGLGNIAYVALNISDPTLQTAATLLYHQLVLSF
jgi:hypothetical protein